MPRPGVFDRGGVPAAAVVTRAWFFVVVFVVALFVRGVPPAKRKSGAESFRSHQFQTTNGTFAAEFVVVRVAAKPPRALAQRAP